MVGGGAAGLYTALRAAREGAEVVLISATALAGSSTYWAQGGLAAAIGVVLLAFVGITLRTSGPGTTHLVTSLMSPPRHGPARRMVGKRVNPVKRAARRRLSCGSGAR